jgi:hypothetical protein
MNLSNPVRRAGFSETAPRNGKSFALEILAVST